MRTRRWMMEYGVATGVASLLTIILSEIPLFRETSVGKLRASDLVQFAGYGGSLVIAWLGARELSVDPPAEWKWIAPFQGVILPFATLLALGIAYGVLLYLLEPFLGKPGRVMYNWVFIVAIVADSVWLILSWIRKCVPLVSSTKPHKLDKAA
ncbi:MAG: hypothetical protein H8K03_06595 [Nitrospira sp.]|nr:hypothetical protein [Nitrospira sp. BO4]